LTWEDHLDDDGITRQYATYDVLIWAEYWEEAKTIFHKAQSMEIDSKTVRGEWRMMGDSTFEEYVYTEGVMAGLCILGDMKTPCFEGAAFFSMDDDSYVKFTEAIKHYFSNGGKDAMNVKVAGLEHEQFSAIWNALNPNFNEEGAYSLNFIPCEIADEHFYALACDQAGKVNKYNYSLNEENNELVFSLVEEMDYKAEFANYEVMKGEFEVAKNTLETTKVEFDTFKTESETKLSDAETRFSELNTQYETLMGEKSTLTAEFEALQTQFNELKAQFEEQSVQFNNQAAALVEKDTKISEQATVISDYENKEKDALINKFTAVMPADSIQEIVDKKESMSINELNNALSVEYTKFSMAKEQKMDIHIPSVPPSDPGREKLFNILNAYKK
jgi:hypothetical protein